MTTEVIQNGRLSAQLQHSISASRSSHIDHVFDGEERRNSYKRWEMNSRILDDVTTQAREIQRPQRVHHLRGSFSYDRPRRVRMPHSANNPLRYSQENLQAQVVAKHNMKVLQSALIFLVVAAAIGLLWFTTLQLAGDPMAALPTDLTTVSVQSGDTLSSIAGKTAPLADRGAMIARIQELNQLAGANVYPGQLLVVPAG